MHTFSYLESHQIKLIDTRTVHAELPPALQLTGASMGASSHQRKQTRSELKGPISCVCMHALRNLESHQIKLIDTRTVHAELPPALQMTGASMGASSHQRKQTRSELKSRSIS